VGDLQRTRVSPAQRTESSMPYQLQFAEWVPVPVSQVFDFFTNPENLPRLMPPQLQTKVDGFQLVAPPPPSQNLNPIEVHHVAGAGSIIDTSLRPISWLSWRRKWTAAITEFEWNHHFTDVQEKGPFKRWHHRHEFLEDDRNGFNGTLVRDVIEYEVGFGPFGALANSLFIRRRISQTFAYRQKNLPKLFAEQIRNNPGTRHSQ
jgi:ligand-binding SRPBCC domain-containing protein